jgi:hypothetical protein
VLKAWADISFVVTLRTRDDLLGNGATFAFDGLEAAARRARDAAGDKDVMVLGAHVAGQLLRAGRDPPALPRREALMPLAVRSVSLSECSGCGS